MSITTAETVAEDVHMFLTAFQMQNPNIQEHILE